MSSFNLDSRLQADTIKVAESPLCLLLLMNDSRYPWLILVPKQTNMREIYQLSDNDQITLQKESSLVAKTLMNSWPLDKINIGALGNIVSQLHIHHVGRRQDDPAWPGPVWGHSAAIPYGTEKQQNIIATLAQSELACLYEFTNK